MLDQVRLTEDLISFGGFGWGPDNSHIAQELAVSPDGAWTAAVFANGDLRVWPLGPDAPLELTWDARAHTGSANAVAFSPDGTRLATAGDDGEIHIWDLTTHQKLATLTGQHHSVVEALAWAPGGTTLYSGSDGLAVANDDLGSSSQVVLDESG